MHFNTTYDSTPANLAHHLMSDNSFSLLAKASAAPKWVLFTAQTELPERDYFVKHHVECEKVVQLKPSNQHNEMEVVIRALTNGNASAVVASDNFDANAKAQLLSLAERSNCCLIFTGTTKALLH
ncbi:superfamily II DNA and RNA helicase [Vibrio ishigakensis]|uniref:Superfamily II DNA and RNA helicase n=1 Tax=Vibrio ishigakensis TaxID=1481914 RepID=A0A0B8QQM1_9VIBR|nr:superfamily II DNA and RNA helicase [Vibrio ishigakensis]